MDDNTLAAVRRFIEQGGTVIAIGSSAAALARVVGTGIGNHLMEGGQPLPRTKFFVPGSVLRMQVDTTHPLAAGIPPEVDAFYDNSPVFTVSRAAAQAGVKRVAWFGSPAPLRSGWAWGQSYLEDGATVVEAPLGRGRAYLFGPEILQRAQPHGTFKFFFNALYYGVAGR
jgi:hypothetical protein